MTEKLLSELTTAQVGGPAKTYVRATSEAEIIEAVSAADAAGDPVLIVGGGSNLLGFPTRDSTEPSCTSPPKA